MDQKYKRLISNSSWTLLGNTGAKLIGFILLPFYTKWLGTEGYGLSDLISTYSSFLIGFITLCLSDSLLIFAKGKDRTLQSGYFSTALNFALLMSVVWAAVFYVVKTYLGDIPALGTFASHAFMIFGMVITTFLQSYSQQFLLSIDKVRLYSVTGLLLTIITFILSFILIPKYGVEGYIWSFVLSNLLTSLFSFLVAGSYRYYRLAFIDQGMLREMLAYSIPLIPNVVMWWFVNSINRPLMEHHLGLSNIGIYAVANKFPSTLTMLYSMIMVAFSVSVLEEYGKPSFEKFYTHIYRTMFSFVVFAAIVLMCFSKLIITIFAAPEFIEAWKYMPIMIIGVVLSCMSSYFGSVFGPVKKSKYFFYSSVCGAIGSIVLNFILIPRFGLYGASISMVFSFAILAVSRYVYSLKFVKVGLSKISCLYMAILVITAILTIIFDSFYIHLCIIVTTLLVLLIVEKGSICVVLRKLPTGVRRKV